MKKFIVFLYVLIQAATLKAQQDEQMSIYMYNPLYFNPAYAGSRDAISAIAVGRFQWVNFDGAPVSQWFSIHSPLMYKSLGIGGHLVNDRIGRRTRTAAFVDLSGSIQINKANDSRLAVGVSAGFDMLSVDFSNVKVNDLTDPYYNQTISTNKPNVGAGIFYYGKRHYFGVSTPRVLEIKVKDPNDILQTLSARHFFLSGGYVFDINSVLKLKPSTLIKYTPHAPFTADVNLSLLSYDKLWTGVMYRFHEAAGVNLAYTLKNTFTFGYIYDFPINGLMTYQSGSHEVFLQYDIKPKKAVYTSPRYF